MRLYTDGVRDVKTAPAYVGGGGGGGGDRTRRFARPVGYGL